MRHAFSLTTRQAARHAGVEQHVLLSNFARHGHWRGVTPRKMPNGRLLWPAAQIRDVAQGEWTALEFGLLTSVGVTLRLDPRQFSKDTAAVLLSLFYTIPYEDRNDADALASRLDLLAQAFQAVSRVGISRFGAGDAAKIRSAFDRLLRTVDGLKGEFAPQKEEA